MKTSGDFFLPLPIPSNLSVAFSTFNYLAFFHFLFFCIYFRCRSVLIWQLLDFSILGVISWPPPWEDMDLGLFPLPPMHLQYTSLPSS